MNKTIMTNDTTIKGAEAGIRCRYCSSPADFSTPQGMMCAPHKKEAEDN